MANKYIECRNCGARVHKTSKYCLNCGRKIDRPLYKNCAAFFCVVLIAVTICRSIAINRVVDKGIEAVMDTLKKTEILDKEPNMDISELENFLNSKNPLEITPDMIRDFLKTQGPSDVQS